MTFKFFYTIICLRTVLYRQITLLASGTTQNIPSQMFNSSIVWLLIHCMAKQQAWWFTYVLSVMYFCIEKVQRFRKVSAFSSQLSKWLPWMSSSHDRTKLDVVVSRYRVLNVCSAELRSPYDSSWRNMIWEVDAAIDSLQESFLLPHQLH